jgi:hypothetical protein
MQDVLVRFQDGTQRIFEDCKRVIKYAPSAGQGYDIEALKIHSAVISIF